MKPYEFNISLPNASITSVIEDELFEAGCDDCLVTSVDEELVLKFIRNANNFIEAIDSAIADIKKTSIDTSSMQVFPVDGMDGETFRSSYGDDIDFKCTFGSSE